MRWRKTPESSEATGRVPRVTAGSEVQGPHARAREKLLEVLMGSMRRNAGSQGEERLAVPTASRYRGSWVLPAPRGTGLSQHPVWR